VLDLAETHHFVDDLLLGLCLLDQVGIRSARRDEVLQVLDVALLLLVTLGEVNLGLTARVYVSDKV